MLIDHRSYIPVRVHHTTDDRLEPRTWFALFQNAIVSIYLFKRKIMQRRVLRSDTVEPQKIKLLPWIESNNEFLVIPYLPQQLPFEQCRTQFFSNEARMMPPLNNCINHIVLMMACKYWFGMHLNTCHR